MEGVSLLAELPWIALTRVAVIRLVVFAAATMAALTAIAAAAPPPRNAVTAAEATIVAITVPGGTPVALGEVEWPRTTTAEVQSFTYPADGSVVSVGLSRASASAQPGAAAVAQASAQAAVLSALRRGGARSTGHGDRYRRSRNEIGRS